MKTCFLFPGQGAQYPGMARDLFDASKAVRDLFELASDATSIDLRALLFESDEETLKNTRNTQISVVLAGAAAALSARERGIVPEGCAGFSVGEWPALAEAGVISHADMFRLVAERGRLMDESGRRAGGTTMSAVLFLSPDAIEKAIAGAGLDQVWVANYNSPGQSVISGTEAQIPLAEEAIKAAGAKRVVRLKVSGAFHSPLMAWARDGFAELLSDVAFADPKIAVYSNVSGARISSGAEAKKLSAVQITSPVRWIAEEAAIATDGFERCIETGPGAVLAGLWKASPSASAGPGGAAIACIAGGTLADITAIAP